MTAAYSTPLDLAQAAHRTFAELACDLAWAIQPATGEVVYANSRAQAVSQAGRLIFSDVAAESAPALRLAITEAQAGRPGELTLQLSSAEQVPVVIAARVFGVPESGNVWVTASMPRPTSVASGLGEVSTETALSAAMRQGIVNGEFLVFYQPIVDTAGALKGCEALMRWRKSDGSWVSPGAFIPAAERNGLITILGDFVLRAAALQLKSFDEAGLTGLFMSINVSPDQLTDPSFEGRLASVVALSGLDPSRIVLELTEGMLIQGPEHIRALLDRITATGVRFSLDDFGTGYSSLSYLKTFPLSTLKVDRSFVKDLVTDEVSRAIASTVIQLSAALNLRTVAEGVESSEQAELLRMMGVDYFQGYYFGRPTEAEDLVKQFA